MRVLYQDQDCWLGVSYNPDINQFFLHTEINIWSKEKYKKYLDIFTRSMLELVDIPKLYSICYTEKSKKFNELFGAKNIGKTKDDNGETIFIMEFDNVW